MLMSLVCAHSNSKAFFSNCLGVAIRYSLGIVVGAFIRLSLVCFVWGFFHWVLSKMNLKRSLLCLSDCDKTALLSLAFCCPAVLLPPCLCFAEFPALVACEIRN